MSPLPLPGRIYVLWESTCLCLGQYLRQEWMRSSRDQPLDQMEMSVPLSLSFFEIVRNATQLRSTLGHFDRKANPKLCPRLETGQFGTVYISALLVQTILSSSGRNLTPSSLHKAHPARE